MTTNPIRFLLVAESLRDRSLFSVLRREGHEVGYLAPPTSDLGAYPLPDDTPIMTLPSMAFENFQPTVVVFPQPYVGGLASEMIRQGTLVVGSSNTHHQLACCDAKYARALFRTAGVPFRRGMWVEDDADLTHTLVSLQAEAEDGDPVPVYLEFLDAGIIRVSTLEHVPDLVQLFSIRKGVRVIPAPPGAPPLKTYVAMAAGKRVLPPMRMHGQTSWRGDCTLEHTEIVLEDVPEEDYASTYFGEISKALTSLRYVGPVTWSVCGEDVIRLSSSLPEGFWAAWALHTDYHKGVGYALLHMARHTLKSHPTKDRVSRVVMERLYPGVSASVLPHKGPTNSCLEEYHQNHSNSWVSIDYVSSEIRGPVLGWRRNLAPLFSGGLGYSQYLSSAEAIGYNKEDTQEEEVTTHDPDPNTPQHAHPPGPECGPSRAEDDSSVSEVLDGDQDADDQHSDRDSEGGGTESGSLCSPDGGNLGEQHDHDGAEAPVGCG